MDQPKTAPAPKQKVGITLIAETLGISIGTVSRALNNRSGVNARTRELVLQEARRIGYVPNQAARSLKDHPGLVIGLFFSPFRAASGEINPAALNLIDAFKKSVTSVGMSLRIVLFTNLQELRREAAGINVAVFYGHFEDEVLASIHGAGIPSVLLQHTPSPYADQVSLVMDTDHAGAAAVEYLAALGHEKIGIVLSPLTEAHGLGLLSGYRRASSEFHLPARNEWVRELPPELANKDGGWQEMEKLIALPDRPTAVIFASDWMALGGLRAAKAAGLRVPRDVSLIGFDNLPISTETDPPLTTFDVHVDKEAEVLTQLVEDIGLQRWQTRLTASRQVLLAPNLIRRGSCFCLRSGK